MKPAAAVIHRRFPISAMCCGRALPHMRKSVKISL
jgi:hypothetical protein